MINAAAQNPLNGGGNHNFMIISARRIYDFYDERNSAD